MRFAKPIRLSSIICLSVVVSACAGGGGPGESSKLQETNTVRRLDTSVRQENSKVDYVIEYEYEKDRCNTGVHVVNGYDRASALSALCSALQDKELNKNCAEDLRKEAFAENCKNQTWPQSNGSHSVVKTPAPVPPASEITPSQPAPAATESVSNSLESCPALDKLAAVGIKPRAGSMGGNFGRSVSFFCEVFSPLADELIKRKNKISQIDIGNFRYNYKTKTLELYHEGTTAADLEALDKAIAYSQETGVELHLAISSPKLSWDENASHLQALKSRIKTLNGTIKSIGIYNAYTEFNLGRQMLWLRSGDSRENIESALSDAAKSAGVLQAWKPLNVETNIDQFSPLSGGLEAVIYTLKTLQPSAKGLIALLQANNYSTLNLSQQLQFGCNTMFKRPSDAQAGKLVIPPFYKSDDPNDEKCSSQDILKSLTLQLALESELGVTLNESVRDASQTRYIKMNPSYKNLQLVTAIKSQVLASSGKVKSISFAEHHYGNSSARFASGVLEINSGIDAKSVNAAVAEALSK